MEWEVLLAPEFDAWLLKQERGVRVAIAAHAGLLKEFGPALGRPQVDTLKGSKLAHLKELRIQYQGAPWRVLFVFDPKRRAILLVGGINKASPDGIKQPSPLQRSGIDDTLPRWRKTMARTLDDFIAALPHDEQYAIKQETERLIAEEMTLQALRKARARSQAQVGHALHIKQAAVSKLERRTDLYLSTLRSYIEALGGELDVVARFPDKTVVHINQFHELGELTPSA